MKLIYLLYLVGGVLISLLVLNLIIDSLVLKIFLMLIGFLFVAGHHVPAFKNWFGKTIY